MLPLFLFPAFSIQPKSVIRPTFISFLVFSGLFMPYQHFFRHLVHIPRPIWVQPKSDDLCGARPCSSQKAAVERFAVPQGTNAHQMPQQPPQGNKKPLNGHTNEGLPLRGVAVQWLYVDLIAIAQSRESRIAWCRPGRQHRPALRPVCQGRPEQKET